MEFLHPKIRNSDFPDNWVEMAGHWESVLTELSQEFQQGLSSVHYKDSSAMNYSEHLFPLNRFPERVRIEKALEEQRSPEPVQGDWLND